MALKILSIGYYGHQNAGDDLLRSSIEYVFREHRLCVSSWEPSIRAMNEADLVVVGGGSLWPDFKFFRRSVAELRHLTTPFCIIGISAKRPDEEILETTKYLVDESAYFHVRDHQSKVVLGGSEKIQVGADLFWWAPWDPIKSGSIKPNQVALALRSSKDISWNPSAIVKAVRESGYTPVAFPFYFGSVKHDNKAEVDDPTFLFDVLGCEHLAPPWSLSPALESEIVIAMRYHAILVAVRLGRLVIGIDCHPKISSFFRDANLPELCVRADEPEVLKSALNNLRENAGFYKARLWEVRNAYVGLGAKDCREFSSLVSEIQPKKPDQLLRWRDWLRSRYRQC